MYKLVIILTTHAIRTNTVFCTAGRAPPTPRPHSSTRYDSAPLSPSSSPSPPPPPHTAAAAAGTSASAAPAWPWTGRWAARSGPCPSPWPSENDETGDYWPKWRSALRCAMRPPAPARPPRAPASSMPTSAAYPSATQATNAHERSTAAHITARAHTDHCPAHSSGMF